MGCIIIFDIDKGHTNHLKLMLQNDRTVHDFRYAQEPQQVTDIADENAVDVLICDIDDKSALTQELLDYFQVIHPDTIVILMSQCENIPFVLDAMNKNNPFRFIMKPCQCTDDILEPIRDAYTYRKRLLQKPAWLAEEPSEDELSLHLEKIGVVMKENKQFQESISCCIVGAIKANTQALFEKDDVILPTFIHHLFDQFLSYKINGTNTFQEYISSLTSHWNRNESGCFFSVLQGKNIKISQKDAPEIAFIVFLLGTFVTELLKSYHVQIAITSKDGYYIIRQTMDVTKTVNLIGEYPYLEKRYPYQEPFSVIIKEILDYISVKCIMGTSEHPFDLKVLVKQER